MKKRVKYTAICKGWELIIHFLRPWSTCKVWISYSDVSSAVCHELYDHPNNLQIESDAFCASGPVVKGFLLWEEESGKQDLSVVEGCDFLVRFEFLMPTFPQLFGMSFMIIQIIYKLNPGRESEGVETSGVERSDCDTRVWVLPKRQNKMAEIILDRQRGYPAKVSHYPVAFICCKQ